MGSYTLWQTGELGGTSQLRRWHSWGLRLRPVGLHGPHSFHDPSLPVVGEPVAAEGNCRDMHLGRSPYGKSQERAGRCPAFHLCFDLLPYLGCGGQRESRRKPGCRGPRHSGRRLPTLPMTARAPLPASDVIVQQPSVS